MVQTTQKHYLLILKGTKHRCTRNPNSIHKPLNTRGLQGGCLGLRSAPVAERSHFLPEKKRSSGGSVSVREERLSPYNSEDFSPSHRHHQLRYFPKLLMSSAIGVQRITATQGARVGLSHKISASHSEFLLSYLHKTL